MTTRKHAFYGILALVSVLGLGMTQSARAFNVTLSQVGSNVVATGSGAVDLTGLSFLGVSGFAGNYLDPATGLILTGTPPNLDTYSGFTGPFSFGSLGGFTFTNSSSGDFVGIWGLIHQLYVPVGYVSGDPLSSSATWNNATFATFGLTPGTYEWTWGTGENQNFTLEIVPDAGSTFSLLGCTLFGLVALRRKLRC